MKRYNEHNKIQYLKERIEELVNFYRKNKVTIHKSNGGIIRGKFEGIEWVEEDGKEPHYYLIIDTDDSRDFNAFECIKLKDLIVSFNGFALTYQES